MWVLHLYGFVLFALCSVWVFNFYGLASVTLFHISLRSVCFHSVQSLFMRRASRFGDGVDSAFVDLRLRRWACVWHCGISFPFLRFVTHCAISIDFAVLIFAFPLFFNFYGLASCTFGHISLRSVSFVIFQSLFMRLAFWFHRVSSVFSGFHLSSTCPCMRFHCVSCLSSVDGAFDDELKPGFGFTTKAP